MEEFEILKCQDLVDEDFAENEMDDLFADGCENEMDDLFADGCENEMDDLFADGLIPGMADECKEANRIEQDSVMWPLCYRRCL